MQTPQSSLQARVLAELSTSSLHTLKDYTRTHTHSGPVRLAALDTQSGPVVFLNIDNIHQVLSKHSLFFQVDYKKSVSFVFPGTDCLQAVSISRDAGEPLAVFGRILDESATLLSYSQALANPELAGMIEVHCPQLEFAEIMQDQSKVIVTIDKCGTTANGALRKFGKWVGNGISKLGGYSRQEVEYTPNRNQTLQTIYNMSENANKLTTSATDKVSGVIDPILNKGRDGVRTLGRKFEHLGPKAEFSSRVIKSTGNAVAQTAYGCFFVLRTIGTTTWAQIVGKLNKKNEAGENKEPTLSLDQTKVTMEKGLLEKTTPQGN